MSLIKFSGLTAIMLVLAASAHAQTYETGSYRNKQGAVPDASGNMPYDIYIDDSRLDERIDKRLDDRFGERIDDRLNWDGQMDGAWDKPAKIFQPKKTNTPADD